LAALLVLASSVVWLQLDRHAYHSIERQCQWQLTQFASIRGNTLAAADQADFTRLIAELAEIHLLVTDTRARLKLLTDRKVGTFGNDDAMIAALRASEEHIRTLEYDNSLAKSSGNLRGIAEHTVKESEISEQICDAAQDAEDRRLFYEGVITILMTALAFYAGRKSLE
jgi:hypothetical protein